MYPCTVERESITSLNLADRHFIARLMWVWSSLYVCPVGVHSAGGGRDLTHTAKGGSAECRSQVYQKHESMHRFEVHSLKKPDCHD